MQKVMNFRPIAIFGLFIVLGGYLISVILSKNLLFMAIGVLGLITLVLVSFCIFKKFNYKLLKQILCLVLLPLVIGASVVGVREAKIINSVPRSGYYEVTGEVQKISNYGSGYSLCLSNPSLYNGKEFELSSYLTLQCNENFMPSDVKIGDTISARVKFTSKFNGTGEDYVLAKTNIGGTCVSLEPLMVTKGNGFKYTVLNSARNKIYNNMSGVAAPVAFGMLFGDKSGMEPDMQKGFSASGTAHILAVSGLHVGFIITLFGFLIGMFVKNNNAKSVILMVLIILYAYLCSFGASVVRAGVMAIVGKLAKLKGKQYDGINALSVSAFVNFTINPLSIFSLSFILSYGVVFAIFTLSPVLKYFFIKRLPENVASTLSVSIAAWIGSFAILLFYMKEFSLYAALINILVVPFVGIIFMSLVVVVLLSFVPLVEILFVVPNFLYGVLIYAVQGFASLKYSLISLVGSFAGVIFLSLALLVLSDYVFYKRKYLCSSIFVIVFFVLTIFKL